MPIIFYEKKSGAQKPDKSIILLDAACAHHVKENGLDVETLDYESIHYMASRETGVPPEALK